MIKSHLLLTIILLSFLLLTNSHAMASSTKVSCALINEDYLAGEPALLPLAPISIQPSDKSARQHLFTHPDLDIYISNAVVVTHSLQKPYISSFAIIAELNKQVVEVRSSVRTYSTDTMSVHFTLRSNARGSLTVSCDSL